MGTEARVELFWLPLGAGGPWAVRAGGAVGSRLLGMSRWFRYEVRAWPDGVLPDERHAVGGPRTLATDARRAGRLLERQCGRLVATTSPTGVEVVDALRRNRGAGSLR